MANDIDKTSPHYKGEFGSIYEVNQKFPSGGVEGDYVAIDGWAHYWNADRGTWCVNAQRDSYWDELITGIIEKFKLIKGATYMGVAGLDTVPQAFTGAKMYYFATVAGTYKNFGGLVVPQGINVLYSENGKNWVNSTLLEVTQELGVSTKKVVSQKALNDALNLKANQSSVNEALAKKANKDLMDIELGKKFDKTSVAHDSGDSEELVMSQKAVSDKLSDLSSTILPVTSKELLGIVREVYVEGIEDMDSVYTITVTKNTDKLHIYISKGSEAISSFYATSTQSEYNVNKKGIIELSPMGDNGKKAYVFADFSKKELGFSKKSNLDIAVASYLDFSPSIKSMLNQQQITGLQGEIFRSEKTIDETVNSKYVNRYKTIVNDKYNAYSIDYYSVEANKYVKIISQLSGVNVAAISLMKEKNSEITTIFDISESTTDVFQVNRTLLIPEGINYVAVSRNTKYTSKCFILGEGQSRLDELQNSKAGKIEVNTEFGNVSSELSNLSSAVLPVTSKELLGIVREVYVEGIEDMDSVYTITVTKNTDKLHIYISKGSEAISSFYATSTQSEYNVNKKGIIELSPMGDNGKKAYVFADFSKKELGFSKKSNLDIAVASYLDFSPSIKSMLNQKQITGITEGQLAINKAIEKKNNNLLYGKTLLAIGDSIVAQNYWQKQVGLVLGMKVRTHAKGGIGIVQMVDGDGSGDAPEDYDPDTFGVSKIYRLNTEDVKDASVIILMGFYNERSGLTNPGAVTDIYPDNNTIAGRLNYAIKRVYEELSKANNNTCRLVICSAHRYGKYAYIDKDSYNDGDELLKVTKMVAEHQSIPCIDLMHNGGINKYNWNLFQKKSTPFNPDYIAVDGVNNGTNKPFDNIQDFPLASENKGKYVTLKGTSDRSYQSDGETWVLKNTAAPWNADQLHLSADGGKLLGNYIAAQLLSL